MNRFLFAAWNIGFAFGAARLVEKLCFLRRNWVMRSCGGWDGSVCRWTCEGLCFLHFWRKTCCSCRNWTLDVTVSFVSGIWGKKALSPCVSRAGLRSDRQPILGWHKVVPMRSMLNASNLYSTGIPYKESIN